MRLPQIPREWNAAAAGISAFLVVVYIASNRPNWAVFCLLLIVVNLLAMMLHD